MSTLSAILLGVIQGITEFFPISSSGHLKLGQMLLGFDNLDQFFLFDLLCHLGTLLALVIVLFPKIKHVITKQRSTAAHIAIATTPLFGCSPFIKWIKGASNHSLLLGIFFLITAAILYVGISCQQASKPSELRNKRWREAFTIGLFQVFALFPGVSRSGSTISAGWILGWEKQEAVVFSFLLAIPTTLGGVGYEMLQLWLEPPAASLVTTIQTTHYLAAFLSSFVVGCGALVFLMRLAMKETFMYFVWYCLGIGLFTIGLSLIRG